MMLSRHKLGFTLIELLVAILIFSIIVTVVYSTFSTGTSVWRRTENATQVYMNINSTLEDLARDLRGALNYKGLEFVGEKDRLYFCYLATTFIKNSQYREIYRTCYYIKPSGRGSEKFDLFERKAPLIKGGFDIDEIPERELVSSLDNFNIEYAYKSSEEVVWKDSWKNPDDVPKGIRIKIYKDDIKLTKYIRVPTGSLVSSKAE